MEDREQEQQSSSASASSSPPDTIAIAITHHGQQHILHFDPEATITDLARRVEETLFIPTANQKLLVPKLGLLKAAALPDPALRLAGHLTDKKIALMGTSSAEIASLHAASQEAAAQAERIASARQQQRRNAPKAWPSSSSRRSQEEESTYTFAALRALPHLPDPGRSLAFLERLRRDPGIRAAMRAHRFRVGLLTEMDPAAYTEATHEGTTRILGLNRNAGEAIELRLRTDAYDGYRDYRTIRRTLCHELAHNVHGPHDRSFWDLCHQIEREVDRASAWKERGGRAVGGDDAVYYEPVGGASEEVAYDHGGWTGGEFVLGGGGSGAGGSGSGSGSGGTISRREIIAKAAEERIKMMANSQQKQRQKQDERDGDSGSSA
ncbi:hypothetical protein SLS62_001691 [Diatrype stigma]|uniref:WLM domain-containing protein n=1 Tax=Diatrype stigma TaxID=117547 RepID=A0AAN9UVY3_9PEZI